MGRAGRQRVQQYFQPDHEAAAVEAVLRQACEGGTPPNWWGN
jgi:hypothetical protein